MLDFFKSDVSIIIILGINFILFISIIISNARINRISKNNKEFMKKLGTGKDITEDLNSYMDRIIDLEAALSETHTYCRQLENKMKDCIQKIGIVRYNAYSDAGNDLSFAVALLDNKNNGIVFNGIYSREMSNIYAKPVVNGKSKYNITEEENQALEKAINSENNNNL
ncbi:MAG: DUF4446 family protein [Clostridia bacterium]|nr:DUF4446 family protein [Clostridia bacterium]